MDKRFPFRGHLFRFPSRSSSPSPFAARPPFFPAKTSITAFPFFTPIASPLALCSRSPFTLCSLFFPPLSMWNNMSYAISMAGERARLCYLWAWEGDGLGRPQIEEGGRKGVSFRTRDESGRRRRAKLLGHFSSPPPSPARNSLSPAYIIYDPSFHFSATPTRPATVA